MQYCKPINYYINAICCRYPVGTQKPVHYDIMDLASKHFNVSITLFKDPRRCKREICDARLIAIYFCAKKTNISFEKIGRLFGGRHHSSVCYAVKTVEDFLDADKSFKIKFLEFQTVIDRNIS